MSRLEKIEGKILNPDELNLKLSFWKFKNCKIVFTNGCFDILHRGHIEYLAKAADLGDLLIIGLNTDSSVVRLKGAERPIQDEKSRALQLASLGFVSAVVLFEEDTPYNLIKTINPDFLVKGSDYKPEDIVGYDIIKKNGGEICTIDFVEGYSTSNLIEKIKKNL
ncbi:MAG: D-glycero-beta-D-manno-heptose 1-phosphate adenylyltransferase [Bacteroidales bacterium]|nr:D-glycero-beta-D-manno-heptose 1-phosphate adenylyltransferase [Bacteroidales bacterium]